MIVACKIVNGLNIGGVIVAGPSLERNPQTGMQVKQETYGGYRLTEVPDKVWKEWLKANVSSAMVENKLIFGAKTADEAKRLCYNRKEISQGAGPMVPEPVDNARSRRK